MALLKLFVNNLISSRPLLNSQRLAKVISAKYAKKIGDIPMKAKIGKVAPSMEKKKLAVETDPNRLANYVCGTNLLKEGGEDIKLSEDSAYPDWLWQLRLEGTTNLDEMDPNTLDYWLVLRNKARKRTSITMKSRKLK